MDNQDRLGKLLENNKVHQEQKIHEREIQEQYETSLQEQFDLLAKNVINPSLQSISENFKNKGIHSAVSSNTNGPYILIIFNNPNEMALSIYFELNMEMKNVLIRAELRQLRGESKEKIIVEKKLNVINDKLIDNVVFNTFKEVYE
jgi:hypothetical protein